MDSVTGLDALFSRFYNFIIEQVSTDKMTLHDRYILSDVINLQ